MRSAFFHPGCRMECLPSALPTGMAQHQVRDQELDALTLQGALDEVDKVKLTLLIDKQEHDLLVLLLFPVEAPGPPPSTLHHLPPTPYPLPSTPSTPQTPNPKAINYTPRTLNPEPSTLNPCCVQARTVPGKGRGMFAKQMIPAGTILHVGENPPCTVINLRITASQKCEAVPRRARISGS